MGTFYGTEEETYYRDDRNQLWCVQSPDLEATGGRPTKVDALPEGAEQLDPRLCLDLDLSGTEWTEVVEIPARDLEDYDDCLAEAVSRTAKKLDVEEWQCTAAWDDDEQRETVLVTVTRSQEAVE